MEALAAALAMLAGGLAFVALLGLTVGTAVLVDRLGALQLRIRTLEGRLRALEEAPRPAAAAVPSPEPTVVPTEEGPAEVPPDEPADVGPEGETLETAAPAPAEAPPLAARAPEPRPAGPSFTLPALSPERIAVWIGASVGAFALLVGGLLALVAITEAGWLGPSARISFALVAGTATWGLGAALRTRVRVLHGALAGVGMGVLYGALFAAHAYYGLLGPLVTFALLVSVSVVAGLRAVVHDARFMAWIGLIGAIMAPALVSTGNNGALGLWAYLLLVLSGVVGAASRRGWPDLVLGSALGAAALFVGWSASWYEPGSAWLAWGGAFVLALPFAGLAARAPRPGADAASDLFLRVSGAAGAALFLVLVTPWFLPIDSVFRDPRNGLEVVRDSGSLRELGVVALAVVPLPLVLAGRWRRTLVLAGVPALLVLPPVFAWGLGWLRVAGPDGLTAVGATVPLLVGLLVHAGARRTGAAWILGWVPVAALGSIAIFGDVPDGSVAIAVVGLVVLGAIGSGTSSSGALLLGTMGAVALHLLVLEVDPDRRSTLWMVGALCVAVGTLSPVALLPRWSADRFPALAWLAGLLGGPALFPAAFLAWEGHLGDDAIGVLPVLLGAHGLLAAAVLTRRHGQGSTSPVLALAVAVALGGVTFALPVQLQERWLTVGWALEGAALAWLGTRLRHPLLPLGAFLLGAAVAVRLLINPWALSWGTADGWPILNWTLYSWGVPTVALVASAHWLARSKVPVAPDVLRVLAMLTGFALVNVEVSHAFQDAGPIELGGATMLQGMVRSLAWGGWGLFLLLVGLGSGSRLTRFVGFSFLMLAAFKVFVFDLWSLPGFVRVGSLVGLGVTLLVAAFLFERLVLRATGPAPEPTPGDREESP